MKERLIIVTSETALLLQYSNCEQEKRHETMFFNDILNLSSTLVFIEVDVSTLIEEDKKGKV